MYKAETNTTAVTAKIKSSSHVTKMLVELVLCPLTFKGAADGSDINEVRTALNSEIVNTNLSFLFSIKKIVTTYIRSGTGLGCVGR